MKKIIALVLSMFVVFSLCTAFTAEELTQKQVIENFKKGLYTGDWVPSTLTEETVKEMAECGIQYTFLWAFSWDNPQKVQELNWCKKYGIKVFLKDYKIDQLKMKDMTTEEIYEIIKPSIGDPAILGYGIYDEPNESQYEDLAVCLEKFYAVSEGMIATVNLYPYRYGSYIDKVADVLKQDFISVDIYPLESEFTEDVYYYNLKEIGDSAREHGQDFWLFIQSMGWGSKRVPDLYDMRWQFYSGLAYGATKFMHFCYSNPAYYPTYDPNFTENGYCAVNDGVKSDLYPVIQQFNQEMQFLAPIIQNYHDLGAFCVTASDKSVEEPMYVSYVMAEPQYRDFRTIKQISADQYILVGGFDHNSDPLKKAFVVTNASDVYKEAEADVSFTLLYSDGPVTVTMDGQTFELLPDENGVYKLHLGAGGGAFVEVVERSRTQEEQKLDEYYSKCYEIINQYYEMSIESSLYEADLLKQFEIVALKYQDLLQMNKMTIEELMVGFEELQAAYSNVRTKEEVAREMAEQVLSDYQQIIPELFDDTTYNTLTKYVQVLIDEMNADVINISHVRIVAENAIKTIGKLKFIGVYGDMNLDNKVSLADIMLMARMVIGVDENHFSYRHIADMNQDGYVKLDDVLVAAKQVLLTT